MKIAHIAPPWLPIPPPNYGGTENVLFNLIEEQVTQNHDVTLFAPGDARTSARLISFIPCSLRVEGVPWSANLKADYHMRRSLRAVQTEHFDIVHTHLSVSTDLCLFPLLPELTTPHLTTLHSRFPFDHTPDWTGDADQFYLHSWASSVHLVTVSQHARTQLPSDLDVIGVVYNGLSLQHYMPVPITSDAYLVWLGRFVPEKGAHLAIEVAKRTGRPLVLAGFIDPGVPDSVRYFHEDIEPHIDQRRIRYIGPVNSIQKNELLTAALGLLNPITWEEPFGMVMIEAMAMGCPVISFERGAAPELIKHGKTGFLVQDAEEMMHFVPQLFHMHRPTIREHVERMFSARAMAENYEKLYQQLRATASAPKPSHT